MWHDIVGPTLCGASAQDCGRGAMGGQQRLGTYLVDDVARNEVHLLKLQHGNSQHGGVAVIEKRVVR